MEDSSHQQHSFSNKGLRRRTKESEWKEVIAFYIALQKCVFLTYLKKGAH